MVLILEGTQRLQERPRLMAEPSVTQRNSEDQTAQGVDTWKDVHTLVSRRDAG